MSNLTIFLSQNTTKSFPVARSNFTIQCAFKLFEVKDNIGRLCFNWFLKYETYKLGIRFPPRDRWFPQQSF